ncbi:DCC1-like thiol-disulfide oxidoreductase family protein [Halarcobacter sp.]|uniref:DCC1-like thiol-disulfide oxidoreductase family protein n=1 Tax=Halarcobacter sp. TaxID=2321133 RepID=UPI0029F5A03C|nr:DCC1-like thiol-disulfide oxidoreductase family protein [Halarcobacter sp.]
MKIELYYDKECPFCKYYANYIELKQNHNLILQNVRESKKTIDEFRNLGFDINDGFIIRVDEKDLYQGSDAIIYLNKISKKRIYFKDNKFFRNYIYSFVKILRKIILNLIGKDTKI